MLELKFITNPVYAIGYSFNIRKNPIVSENLKKKLKEKDEKTYYLFTAGHDAFSAEGFEKINIKKAMDFLMQEKEIKKILKETENNRKRIEKNWNKNSKEILHKISEMTGLSLPDAEIPVFITHPKQPAGHFSKDPLAIFWGTDDKYEHYSNRYLAHELMHFLTQDYKGNKDVMHAIIELADSEIYRMLSRKKDVSGHKRLDSLRKKSAPYWEKYLKGKEEKNINELCKKIEKVI